MLASEITVVTKNNIETHFFNVFQKLFLVYQMHFKNQSSVVVYTFSLLA